MIIGAFVAPVFFIISVYKPFAHRILRQNYNSLEFLCGQITGRRRRRN
jgi:hypothetical protein